MLEPASKSLPAHSSDNHVVGHQHPTQANPLSGYTTGKTGPIYTSPVTACRSGSSGFGFETHVDIVTPGYVGNLTEIPTSGQLSSTQLHFVDGRAAVYSIRDQSQRILQTPQHVYSPQGCSKSLSVNPLTAQDKPKILWTFKESRQNCLKVWFPSKQGAFFHQVSFLCFMVTLWNFPHL